MQPRTGVSLVLVLLAIAFLLAAGLEYRNSWRPAKASWYLYLAVLFALLGLVIFIDPLHRLHSSITGH